MGGVQEVLGKIRFGPYTLKITQIIQFHHLNIFLSNFNTKIYFYYFLVPS
jgi:hypothetical protein